MTEKNEESCCFNCKWWNKPEQDIYIRVSPYIAITYGLAREFRSRYGGYCEEPDKPRGLTAENYCCDNWTTNKSPLE